MFYSSHKLDRCVCYRRISTARTDHQCFVVATNSTGVRVLQIGANTEIQDTMIMGADYYESDEERAAIIAKGGVPMGLGDGTVVRNAIIDKNARIGKNVTICNKEGVDESDQQAHGYMIRSGIVVVLAGATIHDGTEI
jgi:glucose-1-phosphate adenylyltransferase